jgi:hypothetical protein
METVELTLEQLNDWANAQIKCFLPNESEIDSRPLMGKAKNAWLNNWIDTAKIYLQDSKMSDKAIVYFAIREYVGGYNEIGWLTFIKNFIQSNYK